MGNIEDLLSMSHELSRHTVGAEGNTSVRMDNYFFIKASGCELRSLREDQIIKCDLKGNQLNNFHLKPSLETNFHSLMYEKTDCIYVAHTHPTETLKIICTNNVDKFSKERIFPDQVVYNGEESCVVDYAHPGTELRINIQKSLEQYIQIKKYFPDLFLLKNHGIICIGKTAKKCVFSTDICEKAANIFLSPLEGINFLSPIEKKKIVNDKKEKYRREKA